MARRRNSRGRFVKAATAATRRRSTGSKRKSTRRSGKRSMVGDAGKVILGAAIGASLLDEVQGLAEQQGRISERLGVPAAALPLAVGGAAYLLSRNVAGVRKLLPAKYATAALAAGAVASTLAYKQQAAPQFIASKLSEMGVGQPALAGATTSPFTGVDLALNEPAEAASLALSGLSGMRSGSRFGGNAGGFGGN